MKALILKHNKYGLAEVRRFYYIGKKLFAEVDFISLSSVKKVSYPLSDFTDPVTGIEPTLPSGMGVSNSCEFKTPLKKGITSDNHRARSAIMALRLGQCPGNFLDRLTIGLEEVLSGIDWAVSRSRQGKFSTLIFQSEYGKGKTHSLTALAHRASEMKCICSKVVLDGCYVTLTRPMELLGEVVSRATVSLDGNTNPQTLSETFRDHVKDLNLGISGSSILHDACRQITKEMSLNPDIWEIIEDYLECAIGAAPASKQIRKILGGWHALTLPAINVRARVDRPSQCARMLKEWSIAAKCLGATGGLVVLFDEADVDYAMNQSWQADDARRELFQAFETLAKQTDFPLTLGFAVTPDSGESDKASEIVSILGSHSCKVIQLPELSKNDFFNLAKNIGAVYSEAFPGFIMSNNKIETIAGTIVRDLNTTPEGIVPRNFIRRFLDYLDITSLQEQCPT